jgi:molybdopterin converting factor small subunit
VDPDPRRIASGGLRPRRVGGRATAVGRPGAPARRQGARRETDDAQSSRGCRVTAVEAAGEEDRARERPLMPITFHISSGLRSFAGGRDQVEIGGEPDSVAAALEALWALYPGLRDRVANEQGQIREHVNVFVGNENIRYTGGLRTAVPAGGEISILQAVSGG